MIKKLLPPLFLLLLGSGFIMLGQESVSRTYVLVSNPSGIDRQRETIELDWAALAKRLPGLAAGRIKITDISTGAAVISQAFDSDADGKFDRLLFQADFPAAEAVKAFSIELAPQALEAPQSKVFGRYVPEREDDFAWENDRIAFRIYGKQLESQLVSSGLDVWTKRTTALVIDRWYKLGEASYHIDHGEGLDMYSVKESRGCGGSGVWDGKALHVSRNYKEFKVIANGPIRVAFELTYAPWDVNGASVSEVKRITLDAGQNFNRIESRYTVKGKQTPLVIGAGIAQHEPESSGSFIRSFVNGNEDGWLSRWEAYGEHGNLGCALVLATAGAPQLVTETNVDTAKSYPNHLTIVPADADAKVVYYAGAGWDQSGDFADQRAWNDYVANFARRVHNPVRVQFASSALPRTSGLSKRMAASIISQFPAARDLYHNGWSYDSAFFLYATYVVWQTSRDQRLFDYIKQWADSHIDAAGKINPEHYRNAEFRLDDVYPGRVLLALYNETKDERYKQAAFELRSQLASQPRTSEGGYWHKQIYPYQLWLDGLYMAGPFSVSFARTFGDAILMDDAIAQLQIVRKHTIDARTGLLYHGWDEKRIQPWANKETGASAEFWGRAIGWYAMALVEELDQIPVTHPQRAVLLADYKSLMATLVKYQDSKTGMWYQIVDKGDKPDNWIETSSTSMFAYAIARGVRQGILPGSYFAAADKAYQGILAHELLVGTDGSIYLTGTVRIGTLNPRMSKGDYGSYVNTSRQVNDSKGVAPFILLSNEMERARDTRKAMVQMRRRTTVNAAH